MMDTGTPCKDTMSSMYNWAYCAIEYVIFTGMKCADLVNLLTTTHVESYPFCVWGSPTTKSMVTRSHFHSDSGISYSNPVGF